MESWRELPMAGINRCRTCIEMNNLLNLMKYHLFSCKLRKLKDNVGLTRMNNMVGPLMIQCRER